MAEMELSLPEGFVVPVPFSPDAAQTTPNAPGVYLVIDTSGEIVHLDKAFDLQRGFRDRQASVLHDLLAAIR